MVAINFLLCCPSPRDIKEVYVELIKCPYDRLYAKYFPETTAYRLMRDFFLSHLEYTHLMICPDDLVIKAENVEMIRAELEKQDYDNLAGVCNVDLKENADLLNITTNLPHPKRTVPERGQVGWRFYDRIPRNRVHDEDIITVPFSGFAAQAINRKTVERLKFVDDSTFNEQQGLQTGAIDAMWANQCAFAKPPIKQHVMLKNRMKHLKKKNKFWDIMIGDGELRYYPKMKDMYQMVFKEPIGKKREWRMNKSNKVVEGLIDDKSL